MRAWIPQTGKKSEDPTTLVGTHTHPVSLSLSPSDLIVGLSQVLFTATVSEEGNTYLFVDSTVEYLCRGFLSHWQHCSPYYMHCYCTRLKVCRSKLMSILPLKKLYQMFVFPKYSKAPTYEPSRC